MPIGAVRQTYPIFRRDISPTEAARQMVDRAIADGGFVMVPCSGCGEPVGAYIPGRVAQASLKAPQARFKCVRRNCRAVTLTTLGEVRQGKFFSG